MEMEQRKKEKARGVGGVWPLAFLLISSSYFHSSGSSPPHFSLSLTVAHVLSSPCFCPNAANESWNSCTCLKKTIYSNLCCHQNNLWIQLHFKYTRTVKSATSCMALNLVAIWYARCSINKNTHTDKQGWLKDLRAVRSVWSRPVWLTSASVSFWHFGSFPDKYCSCFIQTIVVLLMFMMLSV